MRRILIVICLLLGVGLATFFFLQHNPSSSPAPKAPVTAQSAKEEEEHQAPKETQTAPMPDPRDTLLANILADGSARAEFTAISSVLRHFYKHINKNIPADAFKDHGQYSPESFESNYRKELSNSLATNELTELEKLGKTVIMRQFTQAEREMLSEPSLATAILYARKFKKNPPSAERLAELKELDRKAHLSEQTLASLKTLSKPLQQLAKKLSHQSVSEKLVRKGMLIKLAECTKESSDEDIYTLLQALSSPIKQKEFAIRHAAMVETLQSFGK